MLFWALPFMRTFLTKKTLLSVFLEKNNFFEPTLEPNSFSEYFFSALFWELFSLTAFWIAFLSTFLNMFVHSRIIFLGNAFLSKNTILSTSLSNITFLSVFLSTFLRAFSVERFLSALLSTFLSAFFVEHFFECFFEHYKHNSRYFRTLLQFVGEFFDPEKELCKHPWWSFAAFPRPLCLCRSPPGECRAHLAKWQNWPWAHDSIWLHPLHTANSTQHIFQIKGKTGDTCVDD